MEEKKSRLKDYKASTHLLGHSQNRRQQQLIDLHRTRRQRTFSLKRAVLLQRRGQGGDEVKDSKDESDFYGNEAAIFEEGGESEEEAADATFADMIALPEVCTHCVLFTDAAIAVTVIGSG